VADRTDQELRDLLAEVLGADPAAVAAAPPETSLLSGPLGLDSRRGALLLIEVRDRFGVDVATEDLSLASLESLRTLADFVRDRRG
jgi:acyl carrier protein